MKKIFFIFSLLLLGTATCFAGSFYSNLVVVSTEGSLLASFLAGFGGFSAYVASKQGKHSVVYEKTIDEQNIEYGMFFASYLSETFHTTTIYATVHDSDILLLYFFRDGEQLFFYHSDPGYFIGKETPPVIDGIDELIAAFPAINRKVFLETLTDTDLDAEDIHEKIIALIDLPLWSLGIGYQQFEVQEDLIEELQEEFGIEIKKVDP